MGHYVVIKKKRVDVHTDIKDVQIYPVKRN